MLIRHGIQMNAYQGGPAESSFEEVLSRAYAMGTVPQFSSVEWIFDLSLCTLQCLQQTSFRESTLISLTHRF
jgi:hypothetical protein